MSMNMDGKKGESRFKDIGLKKDYRSIDTSLS
jgi:hypothetical protein